MNLSSLFQILSYVVAIASTAASVVENLRDNKTIKEIELTKEKFAKENERLKRQQHLTDQKNQLILEFLGSTNAYQSSHTFDQKTKALAACGRVTSVCNPKQKKLVMNVRNAIDAMPYEATEQDFQNCAEAISKATSEFRLTEDQSK